MGFLHLFSGLLILNEESFTEYKITAQISCHLLFEQAASKRAIYLTPSQKAILPVQTNPQFDSCKTHNLQITRQHVLPNLLDRARSRQVDPHEAQQRSKAKGS